MRIKKLDKFPGIVVTVLLAILVFISIELKKPFYFLCDDNVNSYLCVYKYSFTTLLEGKIPLYNFHQFLGLPFFATGQTGTLNPAVIISGVLSRLIFKDYYGMIEIMAFIHLILAAIGMHLLADKLFHNSAVSVMAGICWAYNTYNLFLGRSWMIVLLTTAWVPFVILGSLYLYNNLNIKGLFISIIPKVCLFYCGHPQFFFWGMLFDFLTFILYAFWINPDGLNRLKSFLHYVYSCILILLFSLPMLVPMMQLMINSASRGESMDFEYYIIGCTSLSDVLYGAFLPFESVFGHTPQVQISHFGYVFIVFFLAGLPLTVLLKDKNQKKYLISFYLLAFIGLLSASSMIFNTIIYLIPIVNRFRWQFKYLLWFNFYGILAASMVLSIVLDKIKDKKVLKNIAIAVLTVVTVVNMMAFPWLGKSTYWGVYMEGDIRTAIDDSPDIYDDTRYVSLGFPQVIAISEENTYVGFHISDMCYNYSTYFGYHNLLGYDVLLPASSQERLSSIEYDPTTAVAAINSIDAWDDFSYLGVSYVVVYNKYLNYYPDLFDENKFTVFEATDRYTVLKLNEYKSVVRTVSDESISYEENINSISIHTDENYSGGDILVMYSYHPYFRAYVNGKPVEITENDYSTMKINAPAGANDIVIKYVDPYIVPCVLIGLAGIGLFVFSYMYFKRKKG